MEKGKMMYEGKAKQVFATEDPTLAIIHYKDDATAFNGLKKGNIIGKGVVNNLVSNHLFNLLAEHGYRALLKNVSYNDILEADKMLSGVIDDGPRMNAAIAYHLGICQGVHDERMRRKALSAEGRAVAV